ncbi:hypothetical protein F8388_013577 [Cannabis sativa]|uniref:Cationic amino acid transporter C-terminal domain-containing protein n=1 Tax=Cannabis sativa TaxID=3483 RepID=A0A7J6GB50_CANSA|nr:hypothetical protein F8388_013577 [Cannabis sativa]
MGVEEGSVILDEEGSSSSGVRRRGSCSCSKDDFLPEESFKSWGNYVKAIKETPYRLTDRIMTRSVDSTEIVDMKARSQHEMKKTLNWWDLMWFGMGAVIGAGIFVLTGLEANEVAGPAVLLSYVVSGVSALLSVFCYTEFAVEIPVAGGSFAYLRVELGDFVAFIAAGNILLEYIIGNAAVARSWTSYFATLCNYQANDFRIKAHGLTEEYSHLDPIAVGVLAIICVIAVLSTKASSRLNYVASIVHIIVIIFIIIAGLANANTSNYTPFAPHGPRGIFQASAVLFFAYVGFDAVSTMAEETKNPGRDIPIGLVGSMVVTTILYCLLALTLCLMQPYYQIDKEAPFSVAFEAVGMGWAKYVVAAGALKGMTSVLLVGAVGQARYLTHIARTHMMPPWLAQVNEKTGTPVNATIVMLGATAIFALFSDLDILSKLLSISTLFIFSLVALALIIRRYYVSGVTSNVNRSTFGLWASLPQARRPKIWGVPLVPWLPSASIGINMFLLGSIDRASFKRFGLWTGAILVYYFLFGLHASYDTAKEFEKKQSEDGTKLRKVEEGDVSSAVKDESSGAIGSTRFYLPLRMAEVNNEGAKIRRGCWCGKDDFLPEESFKSWGNYVKALKETPNRLKDRVVTRSIDETEVVEMKSRSENEMKKTLNWWDLMWLGMGGVIGAGIFVLTGVEAKESAGPAIVLSYVVSGLSALLSVFCYTEFAVEIPVAALISLSHNSSLIPPQLEGFAGSSLGGSFAYLRVELGDFVAFIAAGNIILEYIIGAAAVARSWTSYFATLCNHNPNDFRIKLHSLSEDYSHLDPIAVLVLAIICLIACLSTKGSSRLNYVASIVHIVVILFIIIAGLTNSNTANYTPFAPFGPRGIFKASAVIFFAYLGFDSVATMAEETKNPGRDIPIGLVGSMVITTVLYCLLSLTICLMQPYQQIDKDAPFSVAFEAVGMNWAKYLVAGGALKGMTSVLLVGAISQARYVTHIARTHMIPPWLAQVNKKTKTPINATVTMQVATATVALFSNLEILAKLLSISTLFIFMLVSMGLIIRRYYVSGVTSNVNRKKLVLCLVVILGSSIATSIYWANSEGWIGYVIFGPLWFLGTWALWAFVPQARSPKIWGVPLVPWLPSGSIAINIFLLGSIDKDSFVRFAMWTGVMLVYYFLFGLHASYDSAKQYENKILEEGDVSSVVKDSDHSGVALKS